MNVIGIDLGASLAKVIECDKNLNIIHKMCRVRACSALPEKEINILLEKFIEEFNINMENIERIILTGVGAPAHRCPEIKEIPAIKIDEFPSIAEGGLCLANKHDAIIASVGTGTAFICAQDNNRRHLGGTGVGGGTLVNLCNRFTKTKSFEEIVELSSIGNLSNVDLTIGDITTEDIPNLPKDITASNFGKLKKEANDADIVLGIINMIFETIGMMAVFASRSCTTKDVILVGTLTKIPYTKTVFERFKSLCDLNFIIPENAEYAVAIGAVIEIA